MCKHCTAHCNESALIRGGKKAALSVACNATFILPRSMCTTQPAAPLSRSLADVYARFDTTTRAIGPKFAAWGGNGRSVTGALDRGYHNPSIARDAVAHGLTKTLTFLEVHNQGMEERQKRNEMMVSQLHSFEPNSHYGRMLKMRYVDIVEREKSIFKGRSACIATPEIAEIARTAFGCRSSGPDVRA
jgi:hypothetical protein